MTSDGKRKQRQLLLSWLALFAGFALVYSRVVMPAEERARQAAFQAKMLYDLTARNERSLSSARQLRASADRVRKDLATLAAQNTAGRAALAALRLLDTQSRIHHVVISDVTPQQTAPQANGAPDNAQLLTVALHGAYRDVLSTIAELSTGDVLVEAQGVDLRRGQPESASDGVDAVLRARLYFGIPTLQKENHDAQTVVR
jgi:hypothetical protein